MEDGSQHLGEGAEDLAFNKVRASVWGDGKVLQTDGGHGCTTMECI